MFSKVLALTLSAVLLVSFAGAQVPATFHPPLAVLRSTHAEGNLSEPHVLQALWYAAAELKVGVERIPRILVIHGGRDVATAGAWTLPPNPTSGAVLIEPTAGGGKVYYLWIMGKPDDDILARGFVQILQKELANGDNDFATPTKRVVARLHSIVRADDLQKSMLAGSTPTP